MDNEINSIVLNDEEGNEIEFDVITKLDIEDKEYLIVVPSDDDSEDAEAVALRIEQDENGKDILVSVDDENEFNLVAEAYEVLFSGEDLN